jgi:glyoxylase I family protein
MYKAHLPPGPVRGLRLSNIALAVQDLEAMARWYRTVLGFVTVERGRFDAVDADYAMIERDGLRLELVSRAGVAKQPVPRIAPPGHLDVPGWKALVLETDDLSAATDTLREHEVEIVWENQRLAEHMRSTLIRDPEGNLINIFGFNYQPYRGVTAA